MDTTYRARLTQERPTSKTPALRGRPMGPASGGPEAPRFGHLRGRSMFGICTVVTPPHSQPKGPYGTSLSVVTPPKECGVSIWHAARRVAGSARRGARRVGAASRHSHSTATRTCMCEHFGECEVAVLRAGLQCGATGMPNRLMPLHCPSARHRTAQARVKARPSEACNTAAQHFSCGETSGNGCGTRECG